MAGSIIRHSGGPLIIKWLCAPPANKRIVWGFLAMGILLRLRQFLFDRSLWVDESLLALNIIHRSPIELLRPLDNNQGAPIGFLLLEKLAVFSLGSSEMALRLLPFVCGVVSIFLFKKVADRFLVPTAVPMAVGLFAILDPLIYYSEEVKQYSSDVTIALLLYLLADSLFDAPLRIRRTFFFYMLAAVAIWFSHPVVLILAAIWTASLLVSLRNNDRQSIILLFFAGVLSLSSFLLFYIFSGYGLNANPTLLAFWQDAFPPVPPSFVADGRWFVDSFFGLFSYLIGPDTTGIATTAFILGTCMYFFQHRTKSILLVAPVALTFLASALHLYPFSGRLLLFLAPSVILLIVAGLETIQSKTRESLPLLSVLLFGILFYHSTLNACLHFSHPETKEEIKPVIEYVRNHRLKGDMLYLYYSSAMPFEYYREQNLIEPMDEIVGRKSREDWKLYREDLDKLRGKERVWILFSHVYPNGASAFKGSRFDEEQLFLDCLDGIGKRLDCARAPGASVYLFDLRVTPQS
jgi:hypothetical protein